VPAENQNDTGTPNACAENAVKAIAPTLTDEDFRRMKKEVPEYLKVGLASPLKTESTTAESTLQQQE